VTIQTTFEDRLLDRLRLVVAANSAPPEPGARHPQRRRWPAAAAGLATAGIATVLAVVIAGGTQAAYAIDSQPDGSVTVHIASLSDAAGLQAALRDRGIPAFVDYSATCRPVPAPPANSATSPDTGGPPGSQVQQALARPPRTSSTRGGVWAEVSKGANGTHGVTFKIYPSSIPAGQNVYITTYSRKMNALSIKVGSKAPTPLCPPAAP
jgi:hypothetical protein